MVDHAPDPAFDRLISLVVRLLRVPVAVVALVDRDRQVFKSQIGLPQPFANQREAPLVGSVAAYVTTQGELVVSDGRVDERLRRTPAVVLLGAVAVACVPLALEGRAVGALCAYDRQPRAWSDDELAGLRELARLAEGELGRREAIAALNDRNDLLNAVFGSMEEALIVADPAGNVVMTNQAADRTFGTEGPEDIEVPSDDPDALPWGVYLTDRITPIALDQVPLMRALEGETVRQVEMFLRTAATPAGRWHSFNASPVLGADGKVHGAVTVSRDITELREALARLESAAVRDELTGLLNRRGFHEQAALAVALADRKQRRLALFYVDLNGMKSINDLQGHAMGDRALAETADLLRRIFRATDLIARLGGDEFVALAPEYELDDDGGAVRARLRAALAEANTRPDRRYRLSASLGVTLYDPTQGRRSIDELLADADARMYEAKQARHMSGTGRIDITQG